MGSFFVPVVNGFAVVSGSGVHVFNRPIFEDSLTLNTAVVASADTIVVGGDSKKVTGLRLAADGSANVVFAVENDRKIAKLVRLNDAHLLMADSSGAVKTVDVKTGEMRELFAHFSPVTALLVLGEHVIVSADIDSQVRVCHVDKPREITHFLLGNASAVVGLYRGENDQQVLCVTRDKVAKYFDLSSGSNLEMDPFANAGKPIQSTKSRKTTKKPKIQEDK